MGVAIVWIIIQFLVQIIHSFSLAALLKLLDSPGKVIGRIALGLSIGDGRDEDDSHETQEDGFQFYFFLLNTVLMMALPIFISRPLRVVGIPVALAKSRFNLETPVARFQVEAESGDFHSLSFSVIIVILFIVGIEITFVQLRYRIIHADFMEEHNP